MAQYRRALGARVRRRGAGGAGAGCGGEYPVSPAEVIGGVLTGREQGFVNVLVLQWRLPRIVLALVIGAALGMSGAIFQALTRNPLGSPDVIGFNFGAYTGALVVIGAFGGGYYLTALGGGVIGGLLTAVVVYLLAYRNGMAGFRLIIVGIGVGAMLSSLNQWIILKIKLHQAITAAVWQQGTLNGLRWEQAVPPVLVCVAIVVVVLVPIGPQLSILQLGDDAAGGLGLRPERAASLISVWGVLLIAVATAAAGPISFVALAAPQLARRVVGTPGVGGLISSAVMGAFLLLSSDLIALRIFAPGRTSGGCGHRGGRRGGVSDLAACHAGPAAVEGGKCNDGSGRTRLVAGIRRSSHRRRLDGGYRRGGHHRDRRSECLRQVHPVAGGLARLLRPVAGQVVLDGADIAGLRTKDVARKLGLLPQSSIAPPEGITVADLVARGRFPHQRVLRQYARSDQQAVADAMAATGVTAISGRPVDELSGGSVSGCGCRWCWRRTRR